jgi:hypothetical protein
MRDEHVAPALAVAFLAGALAAAVALGLNGVRQSDQAWARYLAGFRWQPKDGDDAR